MSLLSFLGQLESLLFARENRQYLLALGCIAITTYFILRRAQRMLRRNSKRVFTRQERHLLPTTPVKGRLVEIGLAEAQYLRMARYHSSALNVFLCANLTLQGEETGFARDTTLLIARIQRALRALQRIHPILRCRLVHSADGESVLLEEDPALELNLHVRVDRDYHDVFTEEVEHSALPIGRHANSPHACWVFLHTENSSALEIALDLSHFAVDGSGLGPLLDNFLALVFDEDRQKQMPEFGAWPQVQEVGLQTVVDREFSYLMQQWLKFKAFLVPIKLAVMEDYVYPPRDTSTADADLVDKFHTLCQAECFSKEETRALLAKCRENKVSITACVAAAFLHETTKYIETDKAYKMTACFVSDSRTICEPAIPAADLAPHVIALPVYMSEARRWRALQGGMSVAETWTEAGSIRQFLTRTLADTTFVKFYSLLLPFFLSNEPSGQKVPQINVSSWSAKSPVRETYGKSTTAAVTVNRVELLQAFSASSFFNLSMYTMVDRFTVSLFCAVPRFNERTTREIFTNAVRRIRRMIEE